MKKAFALVLAVLLVLAPVVEAYAAMPRDGVLVNSGKAPAVSAILDAAQGQSIQQPTGKEKYNYVIPLFDMYGMTVVRGEEMPLMVKVNQSYQHHTEVGVLIYQGTYDQITEESVPVVSSGFKPGDGYKDEFTTYWDTTGYATGDYTVFFYLLNSDGSIHHASVCDVYISDREIPLEGLGVYVHELGRETDTVHMSIYGDDLLSLDAVRYPYHTTNREPVTFRCDTGGIYGGGQAFEIGCGYAPRSDEGTHYISAFIEDGSQRLHETTLTVYREKPNGNFPTITPVGSFDCICFGTERGYQIGLPEGASMEDALFQFSGPGMVEARVEGDVIWLKSLMVDTAGYFLVVTVGDYYVRQYVILREHDLRSYTQSRPTCTQEGLEVTECGKCGQRSEKIAPAYGHALDEATMVVLQEPTATKPGLCSIDCVRCGETVQQETAPIFTDTDAARYYSDPVDYCYENGLMNGVSDTLFGPDNVTTRGMLVTILYRYAGSPETTVENPFEDVDTARYYGNAVLWAYESGVVNGVSKTTFDPDGVCTREMFVTILHRYAVANGLDNGERADLMGYTDEAAVHPYAKDAFAWAVANGVINGMTADTLVPAGQATRAQAATMLYRYIQHIQSLEP